MFDQIEKLKSEYTDKYVVVDSSRPELARFKGVTGQVKTVNMNGRALVEFDDWDANIGWYDIPPDCLKVVPKPAPKPAEKPAAKAPAAPAAKPAAAATGEKRLSPLEMARMQGAAKSGGAPVAKAPPAAPAAKPATEAAPAAGKKLSVSEILAAARAKGGGAAPAKPAAPKPAPEPEVVEEVVEEIVEEVPAPPEPQAAKPTAKKSAGGGALPKDVPGILAYCRAHDTKS